MYFQYQKMYVPGAGSLAEFCKDTGIEIKSLNFSMKARRNM